MHSMRAQVHNAVHVTNEARSRDFSGGGGGGPGEAGEPGPNN